MVPIVYFHGVPGAPRELDLVGGLDRAEGSIWAPDRFALSATLSHDAAVEELARSIIGRYPGGPVRLIAFSLGAMTALQVAARIPMRIEAVDLISAAAPLELSGFLPLMAGRTVFEAARDHPRRFAVMTRMQSGIAALAPGVLLRAMFALAASADRDLLDNPSARAVIATLLRETFHGTAPGYRREIAAYVTPWSPSLVKVRAPVTLWHGTADTWAPITMAESLFEKLPNVVFLKRLPDHAHYSALVAALPLILQKRSTDAES